MKAEEEAIAKITAEEVNCGRQEEVRSKAEMEAKARVTGEEVKRV